MKKFVVILVCLLAVCAFAADKSIIITSATTLNGHAVAPGNYKINYVMKGSAAEVKLIQDGKTIATASGEVVENKDASPYNAVVNKTNADGSNSVIEIQFAKENKVIRLCGEGTAAGK